MKNTLRLLTLTLSMLVATHAQAKFERMTGFSNPGALNMLTYKPAGFTEKAPVVVVLHGCQQKAQSFATETGWKMMADELGLILLLPEQTTGNNGLGCFTWFEKGDITRGRGEIASIANAIDSLEQTEAINTDKVFVTGLSAGATMAAALMANYPEKIKAGAIVSGVSYGCAFQLFQSFTCMFAPGNQSAKTRGDYVRDAAGSFSGTFPKVTIIHGSSDPFVKPANGDHSVAQWTNVHGIDATADNQRALSNSNQVVDEHRAGNKVVVEKITIKGGGHGWPVAARAGCGSTSQFVIETGVCAVRELAKSWNLKK